MLESLKALRRTVLGNARYLGLRLRGLDITVGKGFFVQPHFHLLRRHKLKVGDNVFIGRRAHVGCDLEIGNNVMVAGHVSFVGGDHMIDNIGDTPIRYSGREHNKKTTIEENVWIGHGSTIMAGITIATGAVVAAGSVVTKDVGKDEIVAGVPAKLIRKRKL